MRTELKSREPLIFSSAGTQSLLVDSDNHATLFGADVSVGFDTMVLIKAGETVIYEDTLFANNSPFQLNLDGFGNGVGSGNKGDNLSFTLGASGKVWPKYKIN